MGGREGGKDGRKGHTWSKQQGTASKQKSECGALPCLPLAPPSAWQRGCPSTMYVHLYGAFFSLIFLCCNDAFFFVTGHRKDRFSLNNYYVKNNSNNNVNDNNNNHSNNNINNK